MNGGTLVPNQDVARTPGVAIAVLSTGAKVEQFLDQCFAIVLVHPTHTVDMPSYVQGVAPDDRVRPNRPPRLAFMALYLREV